MKQGESYGSFGNTPSGGTSYNIKNALTPIIRNTPDYDPNAPAKYIYKRKSGSGPAVTEEMYRKDPYFYSKSENPAYTAYIKAQQSGSSGASKGNTPTSAANKTTQQLTQDAMSEYQAAFDQAKKANEDRYGQITAGYDKLYADQTAGYNKRYADVMANLEGYGTQGKKDIVENWRNRTAASNQDLVNSGMYNTTIKNTVGNAETRGINADTARLNESISAQKASAIANLQGDTLQAQNQLMQNKYGVMERRTDQYPNQSLYMQMMQNAGYGLNAENTGGSSTASASQQNSGYGTITVKGADHTPYESKTKLTTTNGVPKLSGFKTELKTPEPWTAGGKYDSSPLMQPKLLINGTPSTTPVLNNDPILNHEWSSAPAVSIPSWAGGTMLDPNKPLPKGVTKVSKSIRDVPIAPKGAKKVTASFGYGGRY